MLARLITPFFNYWRIFTGIHIFINFFLNEIFRCFEHSKHIFIKIAISLFIFSVTTERALRGSKRSVNVAWNSMENGKRKLFSNGKSYRSFWRRSDSHCRSVKISRCRFHGLPIKPYEFPPTGIGNTAKSLSIYKKKKNFLYGNKSIGMHVWERRLVITGRDYGRQVAE